jgi:hypothetical protein
MLRTEIRNKENAKGEKQEQKETVIYTNIVLHWNRYLLML